MKEVIDLISLFDPKTATKVRKGVRIAKAVDKVITKSTAKKK